MDDCNKRRIIIGVRNIGNHREGLREMEMFFNRDVKKSTVPSAHSSHVKKSNVKARETPIERDTEEINEREMEMFLPA